MTLPSTEELRTLRAEITEGPWDYAYNEAEHCSPHTIMANGYFVASTHECCPGAPEVENARAISLTPDLLDEVIRLRAAIAAPRYGYERVVEVFDKNETAGSFLREDGEGGFASGVARMAAEIDRLRERVAELEAERNQAMQAERERMWEWCAKRQKVTGAAWQRAARKALVGDMTELRNRIDLIDAGPLEIVQSEAEITPLPDADLDALVDGWSKLIGEAEQEASVDAEDAEASGERVDLWDYNVMVDLHTARMTLTALRASHDAARIEGYRIAKAEAEKLGAHIVAPEHCEALRRGGGHG